jgi:hypothetical protein
MEHKSIYAALVAAQKEFGQVKKGSVNPAFKSRYADLADVATVVIPTLSEHDVAVMHYMVGEGLSIMRTEFYHAPSATKVWCDVPLIFDRANMQGQKSATTYAKRIGLESLSGLAPEDDDGNAARQGKPSAAPEKSSDAYLASFATQTEKPTAPPEWEGWLAHLAHADRVQLIDQVIKVHSEFEAVEAIREQVVASGKPTEKTSFGAARSVINAVARAVNADPVAVIKKAGGAL